MIVVDRLKKSFGKLTVLDEVSFEIKSGIVAVLGPNGSGKTTFLKILLGMVIPEKGRITYNKSPILWVVGLPQADHIPAADCALSG